MLDDLRDAGLGLFTTATNPAFDFSISGLLHSMAELLSCSATFAKGPEASGQRPDMPDRPD